MIQVRCDAQHNAVLIDFVGQVDVAQAEQAFREIDLVLAKLGPGFRILLDYSAVDSFDIEVEDWAKKTMSAVNARGPKEVLRVLPDPAMDIGFEILSRSYYSPKVKRLTFRNRQEAEEYLKKARVP